MGTALQGKLRAPGWAWKGSLQKESASKDNVSQESSHIASLAARLAAIRVPSPSKPKTDDDKENLLEAWESNFEKRLQSGVTSRSELASITVEKLKKNLQVKSKVKQCQAEEVKSRVSLDNQCQREEVKSRLGPDNQSQREEVKTRVSPDNQAQTSHGGERPTAAPQVKGEWTRMWTQLAEPEGGEGNAGQEGAGAMHAASKGSEGQEASEPQQLQAVAADIASLPSQVDTTSYLLGERAALERVFQQVVPQRDQVTSLHGAVSQLQSASQQEAVRLRRLENAGNVLQISIVAASERLHKMEQTVPAVEASLAELRGHIAGMAHMAAEMTAVRASLAVLEANQAHMNERLSYTSSSFFKFLTGTWGRLLSYLARADVAALYLARKILLDSADNTDTLSGPIRALPTDVQASPANFEWSAGHVHALARAVSRHKKVRSAAGAILVVAAVEATWRLQRAARRPLPKMLQSMTVPLDTCLRIARVCVWASAFVVGAEELKKGCYSAADSVAKVQGSLAEGISSSSALILEGVTLRTQHMRYKWGLFRDRLAKSSARLGFEGPVEKDGDLEEVISHESSRRELDVVVSGQRLRTWD